MECSVSSSLCTYHDLDLDPNPDSSEQNPTIQFHHLCSTHLRPYTLETAASRPRCYAQKIQIMKMQMMKRQRERKQKQMQIYRNDQEIQSFIKLLSPIITNERRLIALLALFLLAKYKDYYNLSPFKQLPFGLDLLPCMR